MSQQQSGNSGVVQRFKDFFSPNNAAKMQTQMERYDKLGLEFAKRIDVANAKDQLMSLNTILTTKSDETITPQFKANAVNSAIDQLAWPFLNPSSSRLGAHLLKSWYLVWSSYSWYISGMELGLLMLPNDEKVRKINEEIELVVKDGVLTPGKVVLGYMWDEKYVAAESQITIIRNMEPSFGQGGNGGLDARLKEILDKGAKDAEG